MLRLPIHGNLSAIDIERIVDLVNGACHQPLSAH
jgi:hypothetical protein